MKYLLVLWCAGPGDYSGSDLIFDNLVEPLYHLSVATWSHLHHLALSCLVSLLDDLLQPLHLHLLSALDCITSILYNCHHYSLQYLQSALSSSQDLIQGAIVRLSAVPIEVLNLLLDPFTGGSYYASVTVGMIQSSYNKIKLYHSYNEENPIYFSKLYKYYQGMFISEFLRLADVFWRSVEIITKPLIAQFTSNLGHFYRKIVEVCDNNCSQIFSFVSSFWYSVSDWFISFPATFKLYFHEMTFITRFISYVLDSLSNCAHFILKYLIMCYEVFVNFILDLQKSTFPQFYKKHNKQQRLFSQVFKEMIKRMK